MSLVHDETELNLVFPDTIKLGAWLSALLVEAARTEANPVSGHC